jgi:hypothetical protein
MFPENKSICLSVKTLFALWQKASLGHLVIFWETYRIISKKG